MWRKSGVARRIRRAGPTSCGGKAGGSVTTIRSDKTGTLTQRGVTATVLDVAGMRLSFGEAHAVGHAVAARAIRRETQPETPVRLGPWPRAPSRDQPAAGSCAPDRSAYGVSLVMRGSSTGPPTVKW